MVLAVNVKRLKHRGSEASDLFRVWTNDLCLREQRQIYVDRQDKRGWLFFSRSWQPHADRWPCHVCVCACLCASPSNLYLQTTLPPFCCYLWMLLPPLTAHLHYSPDSGIGNLSRILISLKLQFTWIFVGVLGAGCSLADSPALPPTASLASSSSLLPQAEGKIFPPSLKVTFPLEISKHVAFFFIINM